MSTDGQSPAYIAAEQNLPEVLALLLEAKADPSAATTDDGTTPVYIAAEREHVELLRLLLEAKADPSAATTDDGTTPINIASERGHLDVVELLLEAKADPSTATVTDGATPVFAASQEGHLDVVAMLLAAGATTSNVLTGGDSYNGQGVVSVAAEGGHLDVVRLLVAAGAPTGTVLASNGATDLWLACKGGHADVVRYLLNLDTVEINRPRSDPPLTNLTPDLRGPGTTALWIAAHYGEYEVVQLLLTAKADPSTAATDTGRTPLHAAANRGHAEVISQLVEHVPDLEVVDSDGRTAWTLAARRRHTNAADVLRSAGALELEFTEPESLDYSDDSDDSTDDENDDDNSDDSDGVNVGLKVGMGDRFCIEKSLSSLDKFIRTRGKLDPSDFHVSDPREDAYGEGVTRQWVHRTGRTLLLSPLLFVESDSFPAIASEVIQQQRKWKFKTVALAVVALAKFQGKLAIVAENLERTVSISPLSQPTAGSSAAQQLIGAGRLLGIALVQKSPLGVLISAPTCKLLLGGANVVDWEDLAAVLPSKRFGAVMLCMSDNVTESERQIRFKEDVLGLFGSEEEPVFEIESRASRRHALALEKRSALQQIAAAAASVPELTAAVDVTTAALAAATVALDSAESMQANDNVKVAGRGADAQQFHLCMHAVSALATSEPTSPVAAAKFALEWMATSQATRAEGGEPTTIVAASKAAVLEAYGNVVRAKSALTVAVRSAGEAAIAAPDLAAAAATAAAAAVPRAPSRTDSAIDDGTEETTVVDLSFGLEVDSAVEAFDGTGWFKATVLAFTASTVTVHYHNRGSDKDETVEISKTRNTATNVGEFIRGWATKELVVNTSEQIKLMLQGVSDIAGGAKALRRFTRGHQSHGDGWQSLQQAIRGAVELDVKEWRAKTDHSYRGGPQSRAAADLFWELVEKMTIEKKQKFLYFWCSEAPPAGGLSKLKERLQLRLEDPDGFFEAHTCFFQLQFPATTDSKKMQTMLDIAVEYWDKFGLE
jgi:ankyrin repeat protein